MGAHNTITTGLQGLKPVVVGQDMLPASVLARRATTARGKGWARGVGVAVALLGGVFVLTPDHGRLISAAEAARDAARVELRAVEAQQSAMLARQRQIESSLSAWDRAAGRLDWSGLLHAIAGASTPDTMLHGIELTPPERDSAHYTLVLSGSEQSHAAVSALTMALESIPVLRSVALRRADRVTEGGQDRVRFVLACEVGLREEEEGR